MSDPAIDAAQRARPVIALTTPDTVKLAIAAAREALAPLREWHARVHGLSRLIVDPRERGALVELLDQIAPLLYSSDELGDNP